MYIAPGQGQTTPWGQMLISTEIPYHFAHLLQVLKQSLVWFYTRFFMFFHIYIARAGADIWDKIFDDNRKAFSLCPYVASFKMISLKSDFIHFDDFIHVYSPWARAYNPLGANFWCQQKALISLPICCRFKKNCFEIAFYIHFFHVSPLCI